MQKIWWTFSPRDGWLRCAEREALICKALLERAGSELEGHKVVCIDRRFDVAKVAQMRRPLILLAQKTLDALRALEPSIENVLAAIHPQISMRIDDRVAGPDSIFFVDLDFCPPAASPISFLRW